MASQEFRKQLTVDVCAAPDPLGMVRLVRSSLRPRIALAVKAVDIDRCINDFTDRHFTVFHSHHLALLKNGTDDCIG